MSALFAHSGLWFDIPLVLVVLGLFAVAVRDELRGNGWLR